ncbi:MAG: hypothetical protein PHX71_09640, partial [Synergistales bacterium]|nr:hypothetical protein [Synergistales bacterium]
YKFRELRMKRVAHGEPIKNITARELAVFYCGKSPNLRNDVSFSCGFMIPSPFRGNKNRGRSCPVMGKRFRSSKKSDSTPHLGMI